MQSSSQKNLTKRIESFPVHIPHYLDKSLNLTKRIESVIRNCGVSAGENQNLTKRIESELPVEVGKLRSTCMNLTKRIESEPQWAAKQGTDVRISQRELKDIESLIYAVLDNRNLTKRIESHEAYYCFESLKDESHKEN